MERIISAHFNVAFFRKVEEIAHAITDLYCTYFSASLIPVFSLFAGELGDVGPPEDGVRLLHRPRRRVQHLLHLQPGGHQHRPVRPVPEILVPDKGESTFSTIAD